MSENNDTPANITISPHAQNNDDDQPNDENDGNVVDINYHDDEVCPR